MRHWLGALALIAAMQVPMNAEEQCELIRVDESGALVVRSHGAEQRMAILGIAVVQPRQALYVEIIAERIPRTSRTLRYRVRSPGPPPRALFHYLAWHDKSGDVWQDLALTLLEQGAARVSDEQFPERAEYLRHQRP
jgi:hypothetical protein